MTVSSVSQIDCRDAILILATRKTWNGRRQRYRRYQDAPDACSNNLTTQGEMTKIYSSSKLVP